MCVSCSFLKPKHFIPCSHISLVLSLPDWAKYQNTHAKTSTCYMQVCMHIDTAADSAKETCETQMKWKHPITLSLTLSFPHGQSVCVCVCVFIRSWKWAKHWRTSYACVPVVSMEYFNKQGTDLLYELLCVCKWWHKAKSWLMFHSENIYVDLLMATMLPFKESAKETEKDTEFKHTLTNKGSN